MTQSLASQLLAARLGALKPIRSIKMAKGTDGTRLKAATGRSLTYHAPRTPLSRIASFLRAPACRHFGSAGIAWWGIPFDGGRQQSPGHSSRDPVKFATSRAGMRSAHSTVTETGPFYPRHASRHSAMRAIFLIYDLVKKSLSDIAAYYRPFRNAGVFH